jgi:hypothetical protein
MTTAPIIDPPKTHNLPSVIELARETWDNFNKFLNSHPVIQTAEDAAAAAPWRDRAKAILADLEAARKAKTEPLHKAWKTAIAEFKPAEDSVTKLLAELNARLTKFAIAEENRRREIAAQAAAEAAEAERIAREAEAKEREAKEDASVGVIDADVGAATQQADAAFDAFEEAAKVARQAEKATTVKIDAGFGARAATLRTNVIPVVVDAAKALASIGLTDDIRDAMLKGARLYKRLHGRWPDGIDEIVERKI